MARAFVRISKCTKIVSILLLAFAVIVDFVFDADFMIHSANWSASLQSEGGKGLEVYGNIFSLLFAFTPVLAEYYIILCSSDKLRGLFHFSTFIIPVTIGGFLKAFYYKGRPYVINQNVKGSACDPGMPSGHSIIAVSTYFSLFRILVEDKGYSSSTQRLGLGILFTAIVLNICFSRITLGDHSFNQLVIGSLVAWNFVINFEYWVFASCLQKIRVFLKPLMVLAFFLTNGIVIFMNYINHKYRENYSFWKYMSKDCDNTFVIGTAQTVPICCWFFAVLFYFPISPPTGRYKQGDRVADATLEGNIHPMADLNRASASSKDSRDLANTSPEAEKTFCWQLKRILTHSGLVVVLLIPLAVAGLFLNSVGDGPDNIFVQSLVMAVSMAIVATTLGYCQTWLSYYMLKKCGLLVPEDRLTWDYICAVAEDTVLNGKIPADTQGQYQRVHTNDEHRERLDRTNT